MNMVSKQVDNKDLPVRCWNPTQFSCRYTILCLSSTNHKLNMLFVEMFTTVWYGKTEVVNHFQIFDFILHVS